MRRFRARPPRETRSSGAISVGEGAPLPHLVRSAVIRQKVRGVGTGVRSPAIADAYRASSRRVAGYLVCCAARSEPSERKAAPTRGGTSGPQECARDQLRLSKWSAYG